MEHTHPDILALGLYPLRRTIRSLITELHKLLDEGDIGEAKRVVRKLEQCRLGRRKKKKRRPLEGQHGDGI